MIAAVVGLGAIGRRHARILESIVDEVLTVSRRPGHGGYESVTSLLSARSVDYLVVATETSDHLTQLAELARAGYDGTVLVEKPILSRAEPLPQHRFDRIWVGYNLRFHPALIALREWATRSRVLCATVEVRSHLARWRARDYEDTYSAWEDLGGGVLRDLSHELDYASWILGPLSVEVAGAVRTGALKGTAADVAIAMCRAPEEALVSFYLSFSDPSEERRIRVVTPDGVGDADLGRAVFSVDGDPTPFEVSPDDTYRRMHEAALGGDGQEHLCSVDESLKAVGLIEAIEGAGRA